VAVPVPQDKSGSKSSTQESTPGQRQRYRSSQQADRCALLDELADTVSRRTWLNRESLIRIHIKTTIGIKQLANLTHKDKQGIYRAKIAEGLAPSTEKRIHILLNQVLEVAVRRKYISTNPQKMLRHPKSTELRGRYSDRSKSSGYLMQCEGLGSNALTFLVLLAVLGSVNL
jgi:hypothetical protein